MHRTLDGFLHEDLNRVCADRDLTTDEHHPPNAFYGQAGALRRYAGLPDRPLPLTLEHGIRMDREVGTAELRARLPVMTVPSQRRAEAIRAGAARGRPRTIEPIGFGALYAAELVRRNFGPDPASGDRAGGTLAFPSHSTHHIRTHNASDELAAAWAALPDECQPVVVCLYWKDYHHGEAAAYRAAGLPVVSVGHIFSPDFMLRLHALCRHFRYATANGIGTHLFAASWAGCRFFFTPQGEERFEATPERLAEMSDTAEAFAAARALFGERPPLGAAAEPERAAERATFIAAYLGVESFRAPEELRRLIAGAERRRRWTAAQDAAVAAPRRLLGAAKRRLRATLGSGADR
ncbi:hypothetical protein [Alienimonas californiensis]|uniref:hypothetical protein n=1 Tax=Alienimonas californiensis TaxID=2527989 RepID=UPI0011A3FECF|nr:hypothetical protein [Alienimonas californiensis]